MYWISSFPHADQILPQLHRTSYKVEQVWRNLKVECCHEQLLYWLNYRTSSCINVTETRKGGTGFRMKRRKWTRLDVAAERVKGRSTCYVLRILHVSCCAVRSYDSTWTVCLSTLPFVIEWQTETNISFFNVQQSFSLHILVSAHTTLHIQRTN